MRNEIRFVLVEDEPLILRQLESVLRAIDPRFIIAGCASNGRDGLRLLHEMRPDVVITDIRMPIMDGLDMIAQARQSGIDARYLVLSGYGEFQYARSALRLGVTDYLLKPIDPDLFADKLRTLPDEIDRERADTLQVYLRSWFTEQHAPPEQPVPFDGVCYLLIATHGARAATGYAGHGVGGQFWRDSDFSYLDAFAARWAVRLVHFAGKAANEHVFSVLRPAEAIAGSMRLLATDLLACCGDTHPLSIVVTGALHTAADFEGQIAAATLARMIALPFGRGGVCCLDEDTLCMPADIVPPAFCALAAQLAEQRGSAEVEQALNALGTYWQTDPPCEAVLLRQLEYLLGRLQDGRHATETLAADELLTDAASAEDIIGVLRHFLRAPAQTDAKVGACSQIAEIKRFIDQNYAKPINYRTLYDLFGYNEKYIASLFKKELGVSPGKYLTGVRMEVAKRLLRAQPAAMLKDVAQQVGFSDPLYFSRVFRETTGISPSVFAKNCGPQEDSQS